MKTTKCVLGVVLTLALALTLALPTWAADEQPPVFVEHLPSVVAARTGQTITLMAEAKLPDGVNAELQYQWYATEWFFTTGDGGDFIPIEGATEPYLSFVLRADELPSDLFVVTSRRYRLNAFYEAQDGTAVSVSSDTYLVYNVDLDECYHMLMKAIPFFLPEILGKIVFYPIILPIYLYARLIPFLAYATY